MNQIYKQLGVCMPFKSANKVSNVVMVVNTAYYNKEKFKSTL